MIRLLYNLLWHIGLPFMPLRLWWRGTKEPLYRRDWRQRFGFAFRVPPATRPIIWVHAVSLGETRAAQPLLIALRERYPQHAFLITHMTATGRAAAQELYGHFAELAFLPYDYAWATDRFMLHYKPTLGIVMETEIWPNLLRSAARADVPMLLANARMSQRSANGYAKLGALARQAVAGFKRIGAQTDADAKRLLQLGAQDVAVTGNLKFDIAPGNEKRTEFDTWFTGRRTFFAASTREGEELLLLDALSARPLAADVLIMIVPRHPQRFDEVATLLKKREVNFARRSEGPPTLQQTVMLGDSMGEMSAYYAVADVAFIGGSLLPYGAQNLIEACAAGVPVLLGPSTFNFAQAAELAIAAGAARSVRNADELVQQARVLLDDESQRAVMKQAALEFSNAHRGATARTMTLIESLLVKQVKR